LGMRLVDAGEKCIGLGGYLLPDGHGFGHRYEGERQ
jgi:hypothetical protein